MSRRKGVSAQKVEKKGASTVGGLPHICAGSKIECDHLHRVAVCIEIGKLLGDLSHFAWP
jgi:hypothetical protein